MTSALETGSVTRMPPFGQYGPTGDPSIRLQISDPPALVTLVARRGMKAEVRAAMQESFRLDLADVPRLSRGRDLSAIGLGPGRWMVMAETSQNLLEQLAPLAPHAALTEQSDAYIAFMLSGPRVQDVLAKGVTVDLDASVFPPGAAATTNIAHLNVTFWREAADCYVLLTGRSHAIGLARFLIASGAEFGLVFAAQG